MEVMNTWPESSCPRLTSNAHSWGFATRTTLFSHTVVWHRWMDGQHGLNSSCPHKLDLFMCDGLIVRDFHFPPNTVEVTVMVSPKPLPLFLIGTIFSVESSSVENCLH